MSAPAVPVTSATPVLLIILDGFGHRDPAPGSAIELAIQTGRPLIEFARP